VNVVDALGNGPEHHARGPRHKAQRASFPTIRDLHLRCNPQVMDILVNEELKAYIDPLTLWA
jgi:hypothetical protein